MNKRTHEMLSRLERLGISTDDALAIRRIAMTLHRWHELECGDGNDYGSWAIERDEDDIPFLVHHHYRHGQGEDTVTRHRIPDRETGARKRLTKILAKYSLTAYVQGDPRGAPVWVLRPSDIPQGEATDSFYTRGLAVCG